MGKFTKLGKVMAFIGIWIFASGAAFKTLAVSEPYSTLSIPLMIVGILLLIASNFFKDRRNNQT
ncbi:hypothetical protein [Neobacillus sp. PS3-40]|uniref:hypothetical protein n=1 Tax=Neobacillus sp. PS3-40 TaxID=3070679 RepID=UPI0027E19F27|nr:hypothetical protein [Neobacillus sp. PS3-40]WML44280.1 hypothetical protein RCG20_21335 [Neobacillus sp. PS3-40]